MKKLALIFLVFGCLIKLHGQTIQTDRPSAQTENATTLYKNSFQLEYGTTFSFTDDNLNDIAFPNALYRYGLFDELELRFSNDLLFNKNFGEFKINPMQFGIKGQLFKKEKSQLAILSMLTFKSLRDEEKFYDFQNLSVKLIGSNFISNRLNLGYTFGHNFNPNINGSDINYSLFFNFSINENLNAFFETYGSLYYYESNNYTKTITDEIKYDFGAAYLVNNKLQIDFYMGSDTELKNYFGSIGISYLFMK